MGTRLPWMADRVPWLGHWFLTPDYRERLADVERTFALGAPSAERARLLDDARIVAILVRDRDRALLAAPPPASFAPLPRTGECTLWIRRAP